MYLSTLSAIRCKSNKAMNGFLLACPGLQDNLIIEDEMISHDVLVKPE